MKQKMKRYLGIVFSLVLVLGLIPCMGLTAYADDHIHNFNYEAKDATETEDATITATCSAENCPLDENKATLTIKAPTDLTYNGEPKAVIVDGDTDVLGEPTISYKKGDEPINEAPKDAGTYTASITLSGATASVEYTIARKQVTVTGITAENKTYDGKTDAVLNYDNAEFDGKVGSDTLTVTTTGTFNTKDVGTGKTVTFGSLTLGGDQAANYTLSESSQKTVTADITPKTVGLTWSPNENPIQFTYNGEAQGPTATVNTDDLVSGETCGVTVDGAKTNASETPYTATATALTGDYAGNYALPENKTTQFTIAKANVTVSGIKANDKTYDGNTTAELDCTEASFTGKVDGDDLTITATGTFADDANVGTNKTVNIADLTLGGEAADNYELAEENLQQKTATASITKANVTITANDKTIYVGDKLPDLTEAYTVKGLVDENDLTTKPKLAYQKEGKTVTPDTKTAGTYDIVASDANAGDNYTINYTDGKLTISNRPSPVPQPSGKTNPTVTAPTAKDLTYTGQAQELVNAGKADGGTMEYALGTDDKTAPTTGWTTTVPTGKDAGNYFVWYRVKGDASHNDVAAKCVPATIAADKADKEVADVISKIDALPEKDKVQESDKAAIEAARAAFDALTDEQKAQVPADELKKLTDAEEALKAFEPEQPTVYMRAHVENRGWDAKTTPIGPGTSDYVGTTGQGLRLEAFDMVVPENYKVTGFAHVQNVGDSNVTKVDNPEYDVPKGYAVYRFGTTGRGLRIEGVEIHLLDENDKPVEGFQYAVHQQNIGWEGYVNNGSFTGSRGQSLRLEALRFAYPEADAADTQQ